MEETLLHMQLTQAGGRTKLVDTAPVQHNVSEVRLQPAMWRQRAIKQGRCEAWIGHHWLHETFGLTDWRRFLSAELRIRHGFVNDGDDDRLDVLRRAAQGRWWLRHLYTPRHYGRRAVPALIE
jgi:hypothetical protein